jgi:DNA processing protein
VKPPITVLTPFDPRYPSRLRALRQPPESLTTQGGSLEAKHVVAIVGSRECRPRYADFARHLASELAKRGVVVVSGGAFGIDEAAHMGALDVGGRTWVVAGTGHARVYPKEHKQLFDRIARGPGAMIWPFGPDHERGFLARNRVLVALADAVVVVQASLPSGALSAASRARAQRKPLWVVPPSPWVKKGVAGSRLLLDGGARPLHSIPGFVAALGLTGRRSVRSGAPETRPAKTTKCKLMPRLSPCEDAVLRAISTNPLHLDEIASRANTPAQAAAAALLTLALENVVVEGPPGFYCRRDGR